MMRTLMLIFVKMVQSPSIEARRTTDNSIDLIALLQEQLSPDRKLRTMMKMRGNRPTDKNHPDQ